MVYFILATILILALSVAFFLYTTEVVNNKDNASLIPIDYCKDVLGSKKPKQKNIALAYDIANDRTKSLSNSYYKWSVASWTMQTFLLVVLASIFMKAVDLKVLSLFAFSLYLVCLFGLLTTNKFIKMISPIRQEINSYKTHTLILQKLLKNEVDFFKIKSNNKPFITSVDIDFSILLEILRIIWMSLTSLFVAHALISELENFTRSLSLDDMPSYIKFAPYFTVIAFSLLLLCQSYICYKSALQQKRENSYLKIINTNNIQVNGKTFKEFIEK